MCQQYSAETEAALRQMHHETDAGNSRERELFERRVLYTLKDDPYILDPVRKAIRFYLSKASMPPLDGTTAESNPPTP